MSIPFSKPLITYQELENLKEAFASGDIKGSFNSPFVSRCQKWIESTTKNSQVHLTTSGTAALEFAAMLADIRPGDEVIIPSYGYVSTMNAFILRGAHCIFIDCKQETMNMDESLIEAAITSRTRAIVPIHYSSLCCDMDMIMSIASRHNLLVIEDAACCLGSYYKDRQMGSIGHIGCFSFHATKPFTAGGQGGAVLVNSENLFRRAEVIYENGTNRRSFGRREVSTYTVQDIGSNFQMSETAAACLWAQLSIADSVTNRRVQIWDTYARELSVLESIGVGLPKLPKDTTKHNGGQFWLLCRDPEERRNFIGALKNGNVEAQFHFQPLHSSPLGRRYGLLEGEDKFTTTLSERIVRLPIYYAMSDEEVAKVIEQVHTFFGTLG